jgi:hypothetical protein
MSEFLYPDPDAAPPGLNRRAFIQSALGLAVAGELALPV